MKTLLNPGAHIGVKSGASLIFQFASQSTANGCLTIIHIITIFFIIIVINSCIILLPIFISSLMGMPEKSEHSGTQLPEVGQKKHGIMQIHLNSSEKVRILISWNENMYFSNYASWFIFQFASWSPIIGCTTFFTYIHDHHHQWPFLALQFVLSHLTRNLYVVRQEVFS